MKHYLSHGGGVNSTALMLLLEREGTEFESAFVDHGGDYSETYDYIRYLQELGHPITVIKPSVQGCSTIEKYALKYKTIPSRWGRWCTAKFKIKPLLTYFEKPCVEYVGISAEEKRRAFEKYRHREGKEVQISYPLIKQNITRAGCIEIIRQAGLKVPPRSGCWFCPFMNRKAVRTLYIEHLDLYRRRERMEKNTGRNFYFDQEEHRGARPLPMAAIVGEDSHRLEKYSE